MQKRVAAVFMIFTIILTLIGCDNTSGTDENSMDTGRIKIVVSFNPLREYAEAIGGEKVDIITMVPEGSEPHDFEPKPRDLQTLSNADIFAYNGLGLESWAEEVLKSINNEKLIVVDSSKGVQPIKADEEDHGEDEHDHGEYDPHIWLSIREARTQAGNLRDALVKADPSNEEYYESNFSEFASKLDELYTEFDAKFKEVSNKDFLTGHAAFAYLCRDFGLNQRSVEGVFSEGEAVASKMIELIDFARKNNVKTIFVEKLASPEVSETIAKEAGAKVEKIYSLESKEDGKTYLEAMRDNLEKIYTSLK